MHCAPTTPQATAVTVSPASMETDATVYLMVRAAPLLLISFLFLLWVQLASLFYCAAPPGAPQRVSGKVSGTVTVGSTPIQLNNIDLHAYIVVGDGRAYTAISEVGACATYSHSPCYMNCCHFLFLTCVLIGQVPEPVGWALMPVAPIGELFGWLFALELPNSKGGFKITGKLCVCVSVLP